MHGLSVGKPQPDTEICFYLLFLGFHFEKNAKKPDDPDLLNITTDTGNIWL